jgi:DNA-binding response OmpR family regulator
MEAKKRILLCEDEESLCMLLREYLQAKDYDAVLCPDGERGYSAFIKEHFDLCLLDVMMPKMDGFTLAKEIRKVNQYVPIIFLTAKNMKSDIVEGFKIGADDYLTKPFSMDELVYRIEAIMRRTNNYVARPKSVYYLGDYVFDTARQSLTCGEEVFKLTTKESELLVLLCRHRNQVLGRDFALKTIWADDNYFNARSMDVYISKLRKFFKLDPRVEINNVHGRGYRLVAPGE